MLDVCDPQRVIEESWRSLGCRVQLPAQWADFFERGGRSPTALAERRGYPRYYLRGKAVLQRDGKSYCVYTKDMSRSGFCILHFEQVFPCETIRVFFPSGAVLEGTVVRCRRVADNCFECGATLRHE